MKNLFFIVSFIILLSAEKAQSQAPVFSQYYSSALYLNPALAGLEKDTYLGMNYRSQWSNLSLPFTTFQFSFIQPITKPGTKRKHLGGLGISFFNDVAGTNKEFVTKGVSLALAHNLHLNRHGNNIISCAIQVGASQQRINYDALQWSSQYSSFSGFDQSLPGEPGLIDNQLFHPQLNVGAMWYYTNRQRNLSHYSASVYNGITVSNLIPTQSYFLNQKASTSMLYKVHGGFTSMWSRKVEFSPNYLVQMQGKSFQVNVGAYVGYSILNQQGINKTGATKVMIGLWYRLQDSFIVSTGLGNDLWNFGFSYDANIFSLSRAFGFGSAYEFSLTRRLQSTNGFKRFSSPLI